MINEKGEYYIGAPINMNVILEYSNFDKRKWKDPFFTCFMETDEESIAMWSQHAQPWLQEIRLFFPANKLKIWLKNVSVINFADTTTKSKSDGRIIETGEKTHHCTWWHIQMKTMKKRGGTKEVHVGDTSTKFVTS